MKKLNYLNYYIYRVVLSSILFLIPFFVFFVFRFGFNLKLDPDPEDAVIALFFIILLLVLLLFDNLRLIIKSRVSKNPIYIGEIVDVRSDFWGIRFVIRVDYNGKIIDKEAERLFLLNKNRDIASLAHIIGNKVECYIHIKRIYVKKVLL